LEAGPAVIADLLASFGARRLGRAALRIAALAAAVLLLLLACRRSGERLGRLGERLETSERSMTCSGKCWRRPPVVLAIATSLLGGCGTAGSDRPAAAACPPVVGYGAELQARAAAEVEALPERSVVGNLLSDYAVMRDQVRACIASTGRSSMLTVGPI
jgi:hypothetical protein